MKEYEIVAKFLNGCVGAARPTVYFEEAELNDPEDFVRTKHGADFPKFEKEIMDDGKIVYTYSNGTITYIYEFTEI